MHSNLRRQPSRQLGVWALAGWCSHSASLALFAQAADAPTEIAFQVAQPAPNTYTLTPPTPVVAAHTNQEWAGGLAWLKWSRFTGDWDGTRSLLESNGIAVGTHLTTDASQVLAGGASRHGVVRGLLDVDLTFDPPATVAYPGRHLLCPVF